ncbi:hypothetical protein EV356DRAFT_455308 [Viridothelium virens]|uniref:Proteasome assembly chaperone 3 n=1 Tax=Viridothelium virens TaxID=1048519 RepID=A0A6A6GVV2_VIRVR|nr:hypothetical protein EV356DRAFT_455308 [Viridothelium virens]
MATTAAEQAPPALVNGLHVSTKPIQLSFPLPHSQGTRIHVHLTVREKSLVLFLTTASGEQASSASLGSFVYALPNVNDPSHPLSTALYTVSSTLDFTTRLSKVLAKRTNKPVYVGNSISFAGAGLGGTVEEEMDGFKRVVDIVIAEIQPTGTNS